MLHSTDSSGKAEATAGNDCTPMMMTSADDQRRCGRIAIAGRPNVGKSTLLNALVGQKISITSHKAQTTRHRITGVCTQGGTQFVFVDTPGFQVAGVAGQRGAAALNRTMNRTAQSALSEVEAVLFVVEAGTFTAADEAVLKLIPSTAATVLVANKLDRVKRRDTLLPWLQSMGERHPFAALIPLSAVERDDAQRLLAVLRPLLPVQPWLHDEDTLTDRSERFLAAEIVREKLFRLTGDELPYTSTVLVEKWEEDGSLRRIDATIVVERESHKGIVIGERGGRLKRIGSEARVELEQLLASKVFLQLWVKVRSGWADDLDHLKSYGYE